MSTRDEELVGLWSDAQFNPQSPSGARLIFRPDGAGRYEFLNWMLCSAEIFRWKTTRPGILRLAGECHLQLSDDQQSVIEKPSILGECELPYTITDDDIPIAGQMRVLRLPLKLPMLDRFAFASADLSELENPQFDLDV